MFSFEIMFLRIPKLGYSIEISIYLLVGIVSIELK